MLDQQTKQRNQQRVENTFRVIDIMEDVRDIWRESAPLLDLNDQQTEKLRKKLEKARKAIERIEVSL
jgi:hypothetical protein